MQRRPYRPNGPVDTHFATPSRRTLRVVGFERAAAHLRSVDNSPSPRNPMTRLTKISCNTSRGISVIAIRVLDDAHMTWIAAEVESEHALRAWFKATAPSRAAAYLAYRAAADREEVVARDLQRLSELTRPCQERLARTR